MAYRQDPDLDFLGELESADLDTLVEYLTKDKDGSIRFTEELTTSEEYKKYHPDHKKYWRLIAAELQCFGGNTFATLLRGGEGVLYREILFDVCDKMKIPYDKADSIDTIEMDLLLKILTDSLENFSEGELKEIIKDLDLKTSSPKAQAVTMALQGAVKMGGPASYQIALIVANAVAKQIFGRGLAVAANATLARVIGVFAGPVGWALTGVWTMADVAGPAFRVTIPSVIQVAFLRQKAKQKMFS